MLGKLPTVLYTAPVQISPPNTGFLVSGEGVSA